MVTDAAGRRQCYLVNDRPIMIVETPDGGADCLVLDLRSGSFVVDRSAFSRTLPGDMKDVDSVTPEQMDEIVAGIRAGIVRRMAGVVAATAEDDRRSLIDVLEIDPERPPLDADRVESLPYGGLAIDAPRLLRRIHLEQALGIGLHIPDPSDTVAYRIPADATDRWCEVDAVVPGLTPNGAVTRLTLWLKTPPPPMPGLAH